MYFDGVLKNTANVEVYPPTTYSAYNDFYIGCVRFNLLKVI